MRTLISQSQERHRNSDAYGPIGEMGQLLLESFREWLYSGNSLVRYQIVPAGILDETGPSTDFNAHDFQLTEVALVLSVSASVTVTTVGSVLVLKKRNASNPSS
ncbi:MAG: hypothetical protein ACFFEA_11445 [Candidatus Thorarchaeota archaeon]